jgi:large subunit ribosomal protein L29
MAIMRIKEIRGLDTDALDKRIAELRNEMNAETGIIAAGGKAQNPGKLKEIKRTIARMETVKRERALTAGAKGAS